MARFDYDVVIIGSGFGGSVAGLLTPLAAVGLALTMMGAIVTHVCMGETDRLVVPIVLLALTLFVAIERFGAHSLG